MFAFFHHKSMDYVILCVSLQSKYDVHPKAKVRLLGSTSCCRMAFRIIIR